MADQDLGALSLDELKRLQADVAKAINSYQERQRREALAAAEARAKEFGFSLSELVGSMPKAGRKTTATAKYRHPENPALTWSGRGRRPAWLNDAMAGGQDLGDFLAQR